MQFLNRIVISAIFIFTLVLSGISQSYAANNPVGMLNSIADQMISKLRSNQATLKSNPGLVYSFANQLIVPHADIAEMSRRVLPPQVWNAATSQQRGMFQKEFTTLLIKTYATALSEYRNETINFYPVRGGYQGKSFVRVDSVILRSGGPSIPVTYNLVLRGSQWKLVDLVVEGISLVESFRSQFSDQLQQGNIDNLINRLAQHNASNV